MDFARQPGAFIYYSLVFDLHHQARILNEQSRLPRQGFQQNLLSWQKPVSNWNPIPIPKGLLSTQTSELPTTPSIFLLVQCGIFQRKTLPEVSTLFQIPLKTAGQELNAAPGSLFCAREKLRGRIFLLRNPPGM